MKRFGLIGNPVAGSLSPRLFEAAYAGRYPYDLIEGASFDASWQRFLDDYDGINITAPFKQDAFRAVDRLSENARLCGAVNLAVKTADGIVGYNTDVDGVVLAVREACGRATPCSPGVARHGAGSSGIPGLTRNPSEAAGEPTLREALVVGCGGAGRAAAVAALRLGCRVTLVNRTPARAASLAASLGCAWLPLEALAATPPANDSSPAGIPLPANDSSPAGTPLPSNDPFPAGTPLPVGTADHSLPPTGVGVSPDLIIYTVPGPMEGLPDFPEAVILEANYKTPCLDGHGRVYISGRRWLLYQAVAGYEIFTGERPDADAMFGIFC